MKIFYYLVISNSEMSEKVMIEFCDTYNFKNLTKDPTCFKNVHNPSTIDLILTNKPRSFLNNITIESGLSDQHKLTITIMKTFFQKQPPFKISCRDYKNFNLYLFRNELLKELYSVHGRKVDYDTFEGIIVRLLNQSAPIKEKYVRANNSPFMNKTLFKAVMTRSRLQNKFIKNPNQNNSDNYKKYRNYCTGLFRKEKRSYYSNIDIKNITDNRKFWKTIKPLFSEKHFSNNKIILVEGDEILSDNQEIAETFNIYFANVVKSLEIEGFKTHDFSYTP